MKTAHVPKYIVGGLAGAILVGLLICVIRSEGERTRRMIRDARRAAETTRSEVPQPSQDKNRRPPDTSKPPSEAPGMTPGARGPDQQKPGIATVAEPKPASAESAAGAEEDFRLDDHVVFPGLADEVSKTQMKPRADPPARDRNK